MPWRLLGLFAAAAPAFAQVSLQAGPAKGGVALAGDVAASAPGATAAVQSVVQSAARSATESAAELPADTHALLDEINRLRAQGATCGSQRRDPAPPMRWSALLQRAAELHVRDMAPQRGGSIGHTGSNGSDVGMRVQAVGYRWSTVGENVAAGRPTAAATLAQWMASPGHCNNLMERDFIEVAVAGLHLPGTNYNHYWVMVLAHPWPPAAR